MSAPPHELPIEPRGEGSPSPTLHGVEEWQRLRRQLPSATDDALNELVERYAFDVVWPALAPEARRERLAALDADHKRRLLDQLWARMIEKLTVGATWETLA